MGTWDEIYQEYQKGGEAWATLSEGVDSRFKDFIEKEKFKRKNALDIGCGTGQYVAFLEQHGFQVTGIDDSPTAIEMTSKVASPKAHLHCVNMYDFNYPVAEYDLVFSISTLHHGYKEQIATTLQKIWASLVEGGQVFITLPNFDSSNVWETFKDHTELALGTYAPNAGPETGLPHSFYTEPEIRQLFSQFQINSLELDSIGRWFVKAAKVI